MKLKICLLGILSFVSFSFLSAQTDSSSQKSGSLQELIISGIKTNPKLEVTQVTLKRADLEQKYYGADVPSLLNSTPSVNSYSDNGTGFGYSYLRIRGMDQSRVNHSINGIPLNDPEAQSVYFNNIADLTSGLEQIQVQRGVGISGNGGSSYAGSIQMLTKLVQANQQTEIYAGMGSFGSRRLGLSFQSGIHNNFGVYARIGQVATNGYRISSGMQANNYQLSLAYFIPKGVIAFNMFGGFAKSNLAYAGISASDLINNRTTNPFTQGESDGFNQHFFQLQLSKQLNNKFSYNASTYLVLGKATDFQYFFPKSEYTPLSYFNLPNWFNGTDSVTTSNVMTSYRLNQVFTGAFANMTYTNNRLQAIVGMHVNKFVADHFMVVQNGDSLPPGINGNEHQVYFNTGTKNEWNAYAKISYAFHSKLTGFVDISFRQTGFNYVAKQMAYRLDHTWNVEPMNWFFVNPRFGLNYQLNRAIKFYSNFGLSQREPTRFDYFNDDLANTNINQSAILPEQVFNAEGGIIIHQPDLQVALNGFYMYFKNQIAATGMLNAYGSPINSNVGISYRTGIELDMSVKIHPHLKFVCAYAMSQNKINAIKMRYSNTASLADTFLVFNNTDAAFSPSFILNQGLNFTPNKWLEIEYTNRYVSEQFLDNTSNTNLQLPSYSISDLKFQFKVAQNVKKILPSLSFRIQNVFNEKYCPMGSIQSYTNTLDPKNGTIGSTPLYFPAATRNYFVTLNWLF